MAVTSTFTRTTHSFDSSTFNEFVSVGLTGTYVTGGFTWNPFTIFSGKGSSPLPSSTFIDANFRSTLGYQYVSTISANTVTTKIFSAAGTELSAGALPEAALALVLIKGRK